MYVCVPTIMGLGPTHILFYLLIQQSKPNQSLEFPFYPTTRLQSCGSRQYQGLVCFGFWSDSSRQNSFLVAKRFDPKSASVRIANMKNHPNLATVGIRRFLNPNPCRPLHLRKPRDIQILVTAKLSRNLDSMKISLEKSCPKQALGLFFFINGSNNRASS